MPLAGIPELMHMAKLLKSLVPGSVFSQLVIAVPSRPVSTPPTPLGPAARHLQQGYLLIALEGPRTKVEESLMQQRKL